MKYDMQHVDVLCRKAAEGLQATDLNIFIGIPRGGLTIAALIARHLEGFLHRPISVASSEDPDAVYGPNVKALLVDDIVVTGNSLAMAFTKPHIRNVVTHMYVLVSKGQMLDQVHGIKVASTQTATPQTWVEFPWEAKEQGGAPLDAVTRLIEYLGEDPNRASLKLTPERVLRFYDELREGQEVNVTTFESNVSDLVIVKGISFASLCEHHMLPYWGTATVGYLPDGKILGLSKVPRLVAVCASGLTVQEELSANIAHSVSESANTDNVAVVTKAEHSCMLIRGVKAYGSETVASAMLGEFKESPELRAEFMELRRS